MTQLEQLLAAELAPALAPESGAHLRIEQLRRLTGGASRETWAFDAVTPDGRHDLVLRRDVPDRHPQRGFTHEHAALASAGRAGVPVPAVVAAGGASSALGAPYLVMERLDGETLGPRILREEAFRDARARLTDQCADALARIHAVPVPAGVPDGADPVDELRRRLDAVGTASPIFEVALRWLDRNRAAPEAAGLVHGDFRLGNLMIDEAGLRGVLDWELAHSGDPMEDLGWLCVRSWRFGNELEVGGFGTREELFAAYERASGRAVSPDRVSWWELQGTLRWGIACLEFAQRHLTGETRSVEMAAIGRRACEQEYDVLLLLEQLLEDVP